MLLDFLCCSEIRKLPSSTRFPWASLKLPSFGKPLPPSKENEPVSRALVLADGILLLEAWLSCTVSIVLCRTEREKMSCDQSCSV